MHGPSSLVRPSERPEGRRRKEKKRDKTSNPSLIQGNLNHRSYQTPPTIIYIHIYTYTQYPAHIPKTPSSSFSSSSTPNLNPLKIYRSNNQKNRTEPPSPPKPYTIPRCPSLSLSLSLKRASQRPKTKEK